MVDGWTVPGFTHVRELGRGASGRVMLAVDDVTQTKVAIKYLDERLYADTAFLPRYRTTARALSQLEDPGVADLYDLVEGPGGSAAVVMQWIDGVSLRRLLGTQGPTGPLAALAVLGGSLAGLHTAHTAGVVHQDFKPANLLIDTQGETRITDFGIASPRGGEPPGAPGYLAPELWDGAAATPASDLYAATVMFYECLTGRRPYDTGATGGRAMTALAKAHREAPAPIEAVPGPLRGLIATGLAKNPAGRPATAERFLESLEEAAVAAYGPSWEAQGRSRLKEMAAAAAATPPPSPPPSVAVSGPAARPRGRRRLVLAAAVAVVVVAGGGAAVYGMEAGGDGPSIQPTATVPATKVSSPSPGPTAPVNAALATRIERAAAKRPGAQFTFRRTGCCGPAVNARGTFRNQSFSMTVSGATAQTRRTARTILIGDTAYVRIGADWLPVASADTQTEGYAPLAAQARASSSITNITTLVRNSTPLRRSGRTYRGSVPLAALSDQAFYAGLANDAKAEQLAFTLTLDSSGLPRQLRITVGTGSRGVALSASYTGWGRRVAITAPR